MTVKDITVENFQKYSSVRLVRNDKDKTVIGSGVLYYEQKLSDIAYIITAAHCLFNDEDTFINPLRSIILEIFSPQNNCFERISLPINNETCIMYATAAEDLAVLKLQYKDVQIINPINTPIQIIIDHPSISDLLVYGFPRANDHQLMISPAKWISNQLMENKFDLTTEVDLIEQYVKGYSGGAVFIKNDTDILLLGIFARFLIEERGRIFQCQSFAKLPEILKENNWPSVTISYLCEGGITRNRLNAHNEKTIKNLGRNFNPDLNLETQTRRSIDAVSRNTSFMNKFINEFNEWFNIPQFYGHEQKSVIGKLETEYKSLCKKIAATVRKFDFTINKPLDFSLQKGMVKEFVEKTDTYLKDETIKRNSLHEQGEKERLRKYNDNISRAYALKEYCNKFYYVLEDSQITLSNNPILIIKGEAGCGKSHLLGDIAQTSIKNDTPALLVLARDFEKSTLENNILTQLGVSCKFDTLLQSFNTAAINKNERFLILIDAINETPHSKIWQNQLTGLVEQIKKYPAIGLIITIRSTYIKEVLPVEYQSESNEAINTITHTGFQGKEDEAVSKFCEYYGIKTPSIPLLNPEYSNPLLLHITCEVASHKKLNRIISPHSGITNLFYEYKKYLDVVFDEKEERPYYGLRIVTKSIKALSKFMFENNTFDIDFDTCYDILKTYVGDFPYLLRDLIEEGILLKELRYKDEREYIRFTYQRLNDYFMAEYILRDCSRPSDVTQMFRSPDFKKKLKNNLNLSGIVEQLSIMLPELYDLEFWEVIDVDILNNYYGPDRTAINSLRWRSPNHIDKNKFLKYIESSNADYYDWLNNLILLAAVPGHPFNGDHWHSIMLRANLPMRESFLQEFLLSYYETDSGYPDKHIKRLIEWAWKKNIGKIVEKEVARLASMVMMWFLSSTINSLRDKTTKALVNLLQYQTDALLNIIEVFSDVDDPYILERLYAIAYGCILRTPKIEDKRAIGQTVYNKIFLSGNPPKHILVRDYACCTVEYAVNQAGLTDINLSDILPPYGEDIPVFPKDSDIKHFCIPYDKKEVKYMSAQNYIYDSLIEGLADFGTKIVDSRINDFLPHSHRIEKQYNEFKKSMHRDIFPFVKNYEDCIYNIEIIKNEIRYFNPIFKELYKKDLLGRLKSLEKQVPSLENYLEKFLGKDVTETIINKYVPNHILKGQNRYNYKHNTTGVRNWILKRVFELGYNKDLHGKYDEYVKSIESFSRSNEYDEGRIERIGKKYEWIALNEILGCYADNYKIENPYDTSKSIIYDGAWQNYLRDLDPSCITPRTCYGESIIKQESWQAYDSASYWHLDGLTWLKTKINNHDLHLLIERTDPKGNTWLSLNDINTEHEPVYLGAQIYDCHKRIYNIFLKAFLIKKSSKQELIEYVTGKNLNNINVLEIPGVYTSIITREKYWSRGQKLHEKTYGRKWNYLLKDCPVKAKYLYEEMSGNIEDDHSGTRSNYYMPTKDIYDGLGLRYADEDGVFENIRNEQVACCNPCRTEHYLMRKDILLKYIQENKLDIIWIIDIEKILSNEDRRFRYSEFYCHNGIIFYNDKGDLTSNISIYKRE